MTRKRVSRTPFRMRLARTLEALLSTVSAHELLM
jgi:hypothetical protein